MNIIVGFSTSKAWYSRLICWATKSKVSHTFLLVKMMGELLVFQEGPLGYGAKNFETFKKENQIVDLIVPKVPISLGFMKSLSQLGMPYGYLALIGMAFVMIGRSLGWHVLNPFRGIRAPFCSARNTMILQDSKYPGAEKLDAYSTSPEDLLEFMRKTEFG